MVKTTVNNQEYFNKFTHFKEKEESQREKKMGRKRIKTRIKYLGINLPKEILELWKIPLIEEPSRLQSMGLQRVGHE